jgi:hypothetical protein
VTDLLSFLRQAKNINRKGKMELQPNERLLSGKWLVEGETVVADEVCDRIEWLVKTQLEHLATTESGWDTLYQDLRDRRLWELTYSQSNMHGGGPPQLRLLRINDAVKKYGIKPITNS